ncbi:glycosyltransferase [Hymenobacter busanensis]|uniref:Glycosyltransferase n=1 Tax=Hymenobacter busanensis TaxID=2607656 RepID=A0A7L4ZZT8_9BACT|nr:TIGR04283 family arsenosugar biosynthesis glycosyltransferase [Hymenobacter busanensis]KAA9338523.1 glycosyltransferase [Hymenobacter busanensis]QHJ09049.1 glycosyltransferase [Hymenobacter busanensis]
MLSVIIPTLNEGQALAEVLRHVAGNLGVVPHEIIVCDGGSRDDTCAVARQYGAQVVRTERPSRAAQLNLGAQQAAGELLYFLHADTLPPPRFGVIINQYHAQGYQAGCFRLRFDYRHWILRLSGWASRFNAHNFQFGDQSLFMNAAAFRQLGGFNEELLLMEDVDIVGRIKHLHRFVVMPYEVLTSARKYREYGVSRTELTHLAVFTLYSLHVKQPTLAHWYRKLLHNRRNSTRKAA